MAAKSNWALWSAAWLAGIVVFFLASSPDGVRRSQPPAIGERAGMIIVSSPDETSVQPSNAAVPSTRVERSSLPAREDERLVRQHTARREAGIGAHIESSEIYDLSDFDWTFEQRIGPYLDVDDDGTLGVEVSTIVEDIGPYLEVEAEVDEVSGDGWAFEDDIGQYLDADDEFYEPVASTYQTPINVGEFIDVEAAAGPFDDPGNSYPFDVGESLDVDYP